MVHILLAMEYMHSKKVIHRDLKPNNILLLPDEHDILGHYNIAQVCDFGLAKPFTYQGIQTPNMVTGWFRAPEIALGYPHYDYKSDVWSVACIFFEMINGQQFLYNCVDNNDAIISTIIKKLPYELPMKTMRELVTCSKWRKVTVYKYATVKTRKPWIKQLGLTTDQAKIFINTAGCLDTFCDLLNNMFKFDWDERYNIAQCLDHPFFDEHRDLINLTRQYYSPQPSQERILIIKPSPERKWVTETVEKLFNDKHKYTAWYQHRIIFQAVYLFDHYLEAIFSMENFECEKTIVNNPAYNEKGLVHTKYETLLRFYTCLYSCVKYFMTLQSAVTFETIVLSAPNQGKEFCTQQAKLIASNFESSFISKALGFNVYRPSLYEAADLYNDVLEEEHIQDLLSMYLAVNKPIETTPSILYGHYVKARDAKTKSPPTEELLPS